MFFFLFTFKIPTVNRYEQVSIEKLLGELHFNPTMTNGIPHPTISSLFNNQHKPKQNGFYDYPPTLPPPPRLSSSSSTSSLQPTIIPNSSPKIPPGISLPTTNIITPPTNYISSTNETTNVKPLMAELFPDSTIDAFDEFRRMAAQIHQQFNAPYSKVINAASSPSPPVSSTDNIQMNGGIDKNSRTVLTNAQNKMLPTGTFTKSWKVEHTSGKLISNLSDHVYILLL